MKKNKINFESAAKQIELLMPEELIQPYLKSMEICKDAGILNEIYLRKNILTIIFSSLI